MSYNVLADHLAHDHAAELYTSAPQYALEWAYRRELIVRWAAAPGRQKATWLCIRSFLCHLLDVATRRCLGVTVLPSPDGPPPWAPPARPRREVAEYAPHVVCLQEVDHFRQMREALAPLG